MEKWFDEKVDPDGFGLEDAWLLRDLPHLGVVVSLAKEKRGEPPRLSTWDRKTRQRIRCRASRLEQGRDEPSDQWKRRGLPAFTESGALVFYLQHEWEYAPGMIHGLDFDALETDRRIQGLPAETDLHELMVSPDGQTLHLCRCEQDSRIHTLSCLDGGETLWENQFSWGMRDSGFEFSACSRLGLLWKETDVQSGSDWLSFSLVEARTGVCILTDESSVYSEALRFSGDGREVLLQACDSDRVKRCWTVPEDWQRDREDPALPPPSVFNWEKILEAIDSDPES
jgi:hypothetical protein